MPAPVSPAAITMDTGNNERDHPNSSPINTPSPRHAVRQSLTISLLLCFSFVYDWFVCLSFYYTLGEDGTNTLHCDIESFCYNGGVQEVQEMYFSRRAYLQEHFS